MRRSTLFVAVAVAVAGALAWPGSAVGQVPTGDSVVGSGSVFTTEFTVSVHAGPNGESPTGSLAIQGPGLNLSGTPTCLNVSSNAAVIGFAVNGGFQGFLASVEDNGLPLSGQPVDLVVYTGLLPLEIPPPTSCPAPGDPPPPELVFAGGGPVTSGDIVVVDAPPFPVSKDQCKNGGWRTFGVFKNQGDCVNFVATGGKNPPAG